MQLMEITENDRVVVRSSVLEAFWNQTPHEDRDCADSLNAGASG
jgi:hypothetical protein